MDERSQQIMAGTLEQGAEQIIDVFDGKTVVRTPIAEMQLNGKSKMVPT